MQQNGRYLNEAAKKRKGKRKLVELLACLGGDSKFANEKTAKEEENRAAK